MPSTDDRASAEQRSATTMKRVEQAFEGLLWRSRLVVLLAVIASTVLALGTFYVATVDVVSLTAKIVFYADPGLSPEGRDAMRELIVAKIVKAVDGYLIGAILVMFGLGMYELFINRIDVARHSDALPALLQISSVDDLKDRLAKLIVLVLVIEFFSLATASTYNSALDLLYLALGILFIGGAVYLSGSPRGKKGA